MWIDGQRNGHSNAGMRSYWKKPEPSRLRMMCVTRGGGRVEVSEYEVMVRDLGEAPREIERQRLEVERLHSI